jgi:hypothetical protein
MVKHMGLHITHTLYLFQFAVRTNGIRKPTETRIILGFMLRLTFDIML